MALNLKNDMVEQLARELASETGESLTQAVATALEERLQRVRGRSAKIDRQTLARIQAEFAALPRYDERSEKAISDELWGGA